MDVDTGSDDALAIMTALLSPEYFDVIGICTVHGNRPLPNTTENTLRVVELLKSDVPVIRGCAAPITEAIDPMRFLRVRANEKQIDETEKVAYHAEHLDLPPATRTLTASFPTRSPPCSTTQWSRNICKSDVI